MPGGARSMKGEKQMIYKNITFKADPFSYNLEFDDRITLVGGDSGTGKTVLYEMLEDLRLTDEYKAIKLFNYKSDHFSESIEKCRDSFIVVDNADNLMNDEVRSFINFEPSNQYMLFLVGEFTQNEKWSVKGVLMGECWYKDCCVSEHPDNLRCGKPEVEDGSEKMRMLMQSEEVHKIISIIIG